jgi:hypothetical protein
MKHANEAHRCSTMVIGFILAVLLPVELFALEFLPSYDVEISQTSVSGVSSGGYMAVQFHVAYSSIVKGVGVIAGGPYNCAENSAWRAIRNCMNPGPSDPVPDVQHLLHHRSIGQLARN